jgi:hypothetical protein
MGKHTKDFYKLCMKEPCEGDQAITDYKYEVQAYKAKLVESLMYVDQLRSLLNPMTKAHRIVTEFLYDDKLNEMIGVKELLNKTKEAIKNGPIDRIEGPQRPA